MAPILDRNIARALVEAGYMPLDRYMRMFPEGGCSATHAHQTATRHGTIPFDRRRKPARRKSKVDKAA